MSIPWWRSATGTPKTATNNATTTETAAWAEVSTHHNQTLRFAHFTRPASLIDYSRTSLDGFVIPRCRQFVARTGAERLAWGGPCRSSSRRSTTFAKLFVNATVSGAWPMNACVTEVRWTRGAWAARLVSLAFRKVCQHQIVHYFVWYIIKNVKKNPDLKKKWNLGLWASESVETALRIIISLKDFQLEIKMMIYLGRKNWDPSQFVHDSEGFSTFWDRIYIFLFQNL